MLQLNNLQPLGKSKKRIGRGGSRGGTSGKGHKGQKARSGGSVHPRFEGGQMPLYRRLPKRGFTNARFKKEFETVCLELLEKTFQDGETVTKEMLLEKGILRVKSGLNGRKNYLLKILGDGSLSKKLTIHADAFSKSALKAIQDNGGEAHVIKEM